VVLVALMLACGGAGTDERERKGAEESRAEPDPDAGLWSQFTEQEKADRQKRLEQPRLPTGQKVTLVAGPAVRKGLVPISLGAKAGEGRAQVPDGTMATVVDDPELGGFYQVRISLTSGQRSGRQAWASRGDLQPVEAEQPPVRQRGRRGRR
jgi:hypothetical protein